MEEVRHDFMRMMQEAAAKGPSLEDVRSAPTPHGRLIGCSYYAASNGMQYNSNTLLRIAVSLEGGVQKITYEEKKAFESTSVTVYQPKQDVLAAVQALVERENLAAWSALEYHDPIPCTDYSSSASISLYFDDRSVGGQSRTNASINIRAACQHGGGDVIEQFQDILETAVENAEMLSRTTSESPAFGFGMPMGMLVKDPLTSQMPVQDPSRPAAWKCHICGYDQNTGRFCTECGEKRAT